MALLTLPEQPLKDELQQYSLSVPELISLIDDAYFEEISNWSYVSVMYGSSISNQVEVINFYPTNPLQEVSSMAIFAATARDLFELKSIIIYDKQNGYYPIYASQIEDVEQYNIDLTPPITNILDYELLFDVSNPVPAVNPTSFSILSTNGHAVDTDPVGMLMNSTSEVIVDVTYELANIDFLSNPGGSVRLGFSIAPNLNPGNFSIVYGTIFPPAPNSYIGFQAFGNFAGQGLGIVGDVSEGIKVRFLGSGTNIQVFVNDEFYFSFYGLTGGPDAQLYPYVYSSGAYFDLVTSYKVVEE